MTNSLADSSLFSVPLSFTAHQQAESAFQQQPNPHRGRQVYLNTLAIHAVNYYLNYLGWQTDWQTADSNNALLLRCLDVADLLIESIGRIECRPVLPGATTLEIPAETWENRIGYVAVQLDGALKTATLLGFVPTAAASVPLHQLRSLEDLVGYLDQLRSARAAVAIPSRIANAPVHLSAWLTGQVSQLWQEVESLFVSADLAPQDLAPQDLVPQYLAPQWRSRSFQGQERVRIIEWESADQVDPVASSEPIAVVMMIAPESSINSTHFAIEVQIRPTEHRAYLPNDLEARLLDGTGQEISQARATQTGRIQFELSGKLGEQFYLELILGDRRHIEAFMI